MIVVSNSKKYTFICLLINICEFLVDSFATIYLLEKGASFQQIGIMWTVYLGTTAITDYPTGGLSDKFGRRTIYAIGIFLTSLSYFMILSHTIWIIYLSYCIKGLGLSFISGSLISWLSCDLNDKSKFKSTIGSTRLITNIASFILPIILLTFNTIKMDYIFIVSAWIYLFVGVFVLLFLKENYGSQKKIFTIYKDVVKYCIRSKGLLFIIGVNVALYLFFTIFYFSWQPITKNIIDSNKYLPIFYGGYMLINGCSAYFAKYLDNHKWKGYSLLVMASYLFCFISFYFANKHNSIIFLIIAMALFGISGGIVFMLNNVYINSHAPNEYKSSIYSLVSSVATVANVAFQFVLGLVVDMYGLETLLLFGSVITAVIIFGLIFTSGKIKMETDTTKNNNEILGRG